MYPTNTWYENFIGLNAPYIHTYIHFPQPVVLRPSFPLSIAAAIGAKPLQQHVYSNSLIYTMCMYVCVCMCVPAPQAKSSKLIEGKSLKESNIFIYILKSCYSKIHTYTHTYIHTYIHTHKYAIHIGSTFDNDPSIALFGSLSCKIGNDMRCSIDNKQEQEQ